MSMEMHSPEHIRRHVRTYITIFVALAGLTIITVGLSYLHLPTVWAVLFALFVATLKGSLVACYFMHLLTEKKIVFVVLGICAIFFVALLLLPVATSRM